MPVHSTCHHPAPPDSMDKTSSTMLACLAPLDTAACCTSGPHQALERIFPEMRRGGAALSHDGLSQREPSATREPWCCGTTRHSHPLLPLSATKHTELTGNLPSKPSARRKTRCWACSLASSPIPEETLQEEASDVRRPQSRLVPSLRIEHRPEG